MWRTLVPLALALPGSTSRRGCFTQLPGPLDAEPVSARTATLVAALTNAEGGGLDWRRHSAVSPVQQQHPFGTCWSFGSTGTLEGIMVVQGNRTLQKLSEQQLISCETLDAIKGGPAPVVPWQWLLDNAGGYADTAADYRYNHSCNLCAACGPVPCLPVCLCLSGPLCGSAGA